MPFESKRNRYASRFNRGSRSPLQHFEGAAGEVRLQGRLDGGGGGGEEDALGATAAAAERRHSAALGPPGRGHYLSWNVEAFASR